MTARIAIVLAAAALILSGGAALAQMDDPPANSFYGDPVLPDPPPKPVHVFPPSVATEDVAAVAPAAGTASATTPARPQRAMPCTALNLCAIVAPAARS